MVFPVDLLLEKFCICFFKELCNWPRSNAYISLKLGNPISQGKCRVRLHTQVWHGLGASGVQEFVLCCPRPQGRGKPHCCLPGQRHVLFLVPLTETVALQGSSFMKRSQLQLPALFSPRASYPVLVRGGRTYLSV